MNIYIDFSGLNVIKKRFINSIGPRCFVDEEPLNYINFASHQDLFNYKVIIYQFQVLENCG